MTQRSTICSPAEALLYATGGSASAVDQALMSMLQPMAENLIADYLGYQPVQAEYTEILPDTNTFPLAENDLGWPVDVINDQIAFAYPGASPVLQLSVIPVRSVTALYADWAALGGQGPSDFAPDTLQTLGTDYFIDYDTAVSTPAATNGVSWTGLLRRWYGNWPGRARTIKVTYTAGFSIDELDGKTRVPLSQQPLTIKMAAIEICVAAFKQAKVWGASAGAMGPVTSETLGDYSVTYSEEIMKMVAGFMSSMPIGIQQKLNPFRRMKR